MKPAEELRRETAMNNPNFKVAGMLAAEGLDRLEQGLLAGGPTLAAVAG